MNTKMKQENQSLYATPEGRIDAATAPELQEQLMASLDGIKDFTLDLSEVDYISSAGLRVLVVLQKRMKDQGSMTIINVRPEIVGILKVTGLLKLLNVREA